MWIRWDFGKNLCHIFDFFWSCWCSLLKALICSLTVANSSSDNCANANINSPWDAVLNVAWGSFASHLRLQIIWNSGAIIGTSTSSKMISPSCFVMKIFLVLSVIPFSAMIVKHIVKMDYLPSSSPHIRRVVFSSVELIPNLSSQVSTPVDLSGDDPGVNILLINASKVSVGAVPSIPGVGVDVVVVYRDRIISRKQVDAHSITFLDTSLRNSSWSKCGFLSTLLRLTIVVRKKSLAWTIAGFFDCQAIECVHRSHLRAGHLQIYWSPETMGLAPSVICWILLYLPDCYPQTVAKY